LGWRSGANALLFCRNCALLGPEPCIVGHCQLVSRSDCGHVALSVRLS
jgi:hypothetical protein